jgi:two-component system phosphate regulon response regulator OmpR
MKQATPKILVVDDDPRLRELLVRYLTEQGFQVQALADARELDKKLQRDPPHLLVLDLMLPGEDGLAVCRRLRGSGETVPIIMLTAKGEDIDRIVGLEMGADDYLPKPFTPRELVARIHAVLRRQIERLAPGAPVGEGRISFGPFVLDLSTRTLTRNGATVPMTTGEFGLTETLRYLSLALWGYVHTVRPPGWTRSVVKRTGVWTTRFVTAYDLAHSQSLTHVGECAW